MLCAEEAERRVGACCGLDGGVEQAVEGGVLGLCRQRRIEAERELTWVIVEAKVP